MFHKFNQDFELISVLLLVSLEVYLESRQSSIMNSAQKTKFSIKDFFNKCNQTSVFCRFGHIH